MSRLKLSEIMEAISNNSVIDDKGDNHDVLFMIQDATNLKKVDIFGIINGDDNRLALMVADRMVKNEDFRNIIIAAVTNYFTYRSRASGKDC